MDDPDKANELPERFPDEIETIILKLHVAIVIERTYGFKELSDAVIENGSKAKFFSVDFGTSPFARAFAACGHEGHGVGSDPADQMVSVFYQALAKGSAGVVSVGQKIKGWEVF